MTENCDEKIQHYMGSPKLQSSFDIDGDAILVETAPNYLEILQNRFYYNKEIGKNIWHCMQEVINKLSKNST